MSVEYQVSQLHPNCTLIKSRAITALLTVVRDKTSSTRDFISCCDRLTRILAEEGLAYPNPDTLCCVSVVRSGDILMEAVRQVVIGIAVGKILVQRDEADKQKRPILYYKKLPHNIAERQVILVDPMLATGGSAKMAVQLLVEAGVPAKNIMFLNVICCPEGLRAMAESYPEVRVVTTALDERLNEEKFIVPGLGDFGDRYYSTP